MGTLHKAPPLHEDTQAINEEAVLAGKSPLMLSKP